MSSNSNVNKKKLNSIELFNTKVIEYMKFLDSIIIDTYVQKKKKKLLIKYI